MRPFIPQLVLALSLIPAVFSAPPPNVAPATLEDDVLSKKSVETDGSKLETRDGDEKAVDGPATTKFNGIEVPPMKEITARSFKEDTKDGYWYV